MRVGIGYESGRYVVLAKVPEVDVKVSSFLHYDPSLLFFFILLYLSSFKSVTFHGSLLRNTRCSSAINFMALFSANYESDVKLSNGTPVVKTLRPKGC